VLPTEAPRSSRSSYVLDAVRVLAVMLVVVGHAISYFLPNLGMKPPHAPYIQNFAVVLFFIASGFLIAQQLQRYRNEGKEFLDFFCNRLARIYAGLIPALLFIALIDWAAILSQLTYPFHPAFNIYTLGGNLLMLQDYPLWPKDLLPKMTSFGSARPLWTLAIEWWIYMFVGWIALRQAELSKFRWAPWIALAAFAVVPLAHLYGGRGKALFLYWLAGAAAFILIHRMRPSASEARRLILGAVAVAAMALLRLSLARWDAYDPLFAILVAISFGLAVCAAQGFEGKEPRSASLMKMLAGASFTLYLIHYSIQAHLQSAMLKYGLPSVPVFAAAVIVPLLLAVAIAPYTEGRYRSLARVLQSWTRSSKSADPSAPKPADEQAVAR
jgi:peptidoglycan/LPS O-acetylase OafA/YrhL